MKCRQQIYRENILIVEKQSLAAILITSDYPPTSAINIFSNNQTYFPRHLSFSAMLCLFHTHTHTHTHTLSLSLSVSLLSCSLPTTFGSVFNPVMYHLDHSINVFLQRVVLISKVGPTRNLAPIFQTVSMTRRQKTFKSDLRSTTKCDLIHVNDCYDFGHT
jgi:hypothetical protein